MPEDSCQPVVTSPSACGSTVERIAALEAELLTQRALTNSLDARLCDLFARAVTGITFTSDLQVLLTLANGAFSQGPDNNLTALRELVSTLQGTLNDRVVRGEIDNDGMLKLITANEVTINVGNLIDAVNPVRAIKIRNDNYIVLTLRDGTTQLITDTAIPVPVVGGGGGGSDYLLNFLIDPVNAVSASSGAAGNINVAALGGVTVPLTATHVVLRCAVNHDHVWMGNFQEDSYTDLKISGKVRVTAGRKKEAGDSAVIGTGGVMNMNATLVVVPLPMSNIISYEVISNFNGSPTSPQTNYTTVRAIVDVIGFCKADSQ